MCIPRYVFTKMPVKLQKFQFNCGQRWIEVYILQNLVCMKKIFVCFRQGNEGHCASSGAANLFSSKKELGQNLAQPKTSGKLKNPQVQKFASQQITCWSGHLKTLGQSY